MISPTWTILCNGATSSASPAPTSGRSLKLESRIGAGDKRNIKLDLPTFVNEVYYLPDRFLDLLELAGYVFSADRLVSRGSKDNVEYQSWARELRFEVCVRDPEFWRRGEVTASLSEALQFMTGDRSYEFGFYPLDGGDIGTLFCQEEFTLPQKPTSVVLFSGGLDSLAGVVDRLQNSSDHVCLVSHQSSPTHKGVQNTLSKALAVRSEQRVSHYRFPCTLRTPLGAREESQRTRAFLFCSIAVAIAKAWGQNKILLYENGVTSLNLMRREDLGNARASRTTHPMTLRKLEAFFQNLFEDEFRIKNPSFWQTKADVFSSVRDSAYADLASSTLSCSSLARKSRTASHCGICFQCIDRRLAAYAAKCENLDGPGNYAFDITAHPLPTAESRTTLVDYLRQAGEFAETTAEKLASDRLLELAPVLESIPSTLDDFDLLSEVADLLQRHGEQIRSAIKRIQKLHDDPYKSLQKGCLLSLVASREHLADPVERLANAIEDVLRRGVPSMFRKNLPRDERDLNEKVHGLLTTHRDDLRSEHPEATFACAAFVPDHSLTSTDLLIEAKYIRGNTRPSKAREGIAADLTLRPSGSWMLFLVFDPGRAIPDDAEFALDFESKPDCRICIVR